MHTGGIATVIGHVEDLAAMSTSETDAIVVKSEGRILERNIRRAVTSAVNLVLCRGLYSWLKLLSLGLIKYRTLFYACKVAISGE